MVYLLVPLVCGIILASYIDWSLYLALALIIPSLIALFVVQQRWLIYPTIIAFGLFVASIESHSKGSMAPSQGHFALVVAEGNRAEVIALRDGDGDLWAKSCIKVILSGNLPPNLEDHTTAICSGHFRPFEAEEKSQYRRNMARKGYVGTITLNKFEVVDHPSINFREPLAMRMNHWAVERLKLLELSDESFASAAAMALAQRKWLSDKVKRDYTLSGTSHILALSGLHFGIVLLIISSATYLLPLLHRGDIYADILAIIAIWLFTLVAGMGESVQRAAWMFTLLYLSRLTSRRYNSLNSLFAAATLIIMLDPTSIFDVGFRLSLVAVFAIIWLGAPLATSVKSGNIVLNFISKSLIIGCVATIFTAPFVLYIFGESSLLSPIATLPLLLTLPIVVGAATLWILLPIQPLAPLFRGVIEVSVTIQNYMVEWFASLGTPMLQCEMLQWHLVVIYAILLLISTYMRRTLTVDEKERTFEERLPED